MAWFDRDFIPFFSRFFRAFRYGRGRADLFPFLIRCASIQKGVRSGFDVRSEKNSEFDSRNSEKFFFSLRTGVPGRLCLRFWFLCVWFVLFVFFSGFFYVHFRVVTLWFTGFHLVVCVFFVLFNETIVGEAALAFGPDGNPRWVLFFFLFFFFFFIFFSPPENRFSPVFLKPIFGSLILFRVFQFLSFYFIIHWPWFDWLLYFKDISIVLLSFYKTIKFYWVSVGPYPRPNLT